MGAPILVFPFGYLSHYLRCIVLGRFFEPFYEVSFLTHPEFDRFVCSEGFGTFECDTWDSKAILPFLGRMDFSWLNEISIEHIFRAQVEVLKKYRPFMVIGDNQPTLRMAAEATSVHFISLQNGYFSKYFDGTRPISRRHLLYPLISRLPEKFRDRLTRAGEAAAFRRIQRTFNRVRHRYGLKSHRSYLDEMEGDMTLLCDQPNLFPQRRLPRNYYEISTLIYDGMPDTLPLLPRLDPEKRTVYVCMGSTGDWASLRFMSDPWYSRFNIITAGDTENVLAAVRLANYPFLGASFILPFADLVVCHGGNGMINQCLQFGVPVLCRTTHFEQEWNVAAVEKIGMGLSLDGITRPDRLQQIFSEWITRKERRTRKSGLL